MLVEEQNELTTDLLFTVHQHGEEIRLHLNSFGNKYVTRTTTHTRKKLIRVRERIDENPNPDTQKLKPDSAFLYMNSYKDSESFESSLNVDSIRIRIAWIRINL